MTRIPPDIRRWLYLVTMAVIPLLVAYDVLTDTVAPLWASLAAAVLGVTSGAVAAANVTKPPADE
jgi:hypothetical protein